MDTQVKESAPTAVNLHLSEIHMLSTCVLKRVPDIPFIAGETRTKFGMYSWASVVVF